MLCRQAVRDLCLHSLAINDKMEILFGRDQLPVVISFFICGVFSGIIYDLLKIKRYIIRTPAVILFVDDLLFMLCNAMIVVFNAYAFNNGNIKWYEFPVMITAFFVYKSTLSVLFLKAAFALIALVKKTIFLMLAPVKKALNKAFRLLRCFLERLYLMIVVYIYKRRMLNMDKLIST